MVVRNEMDRYHLAEDVIDRVPGLGSRRAYVKQKIRDLLIDHDEYIRQYGDDQPAVKDWSWMGRAGHVPAPDAAARTSAD
jgi:xylulose-5-phosphate/fructose-6-phosphate phosphoketolase